MSASPAVSSVMPSPAAPPYHMQRPSLALRKPERAGDDTDKQRRGGPGDWLRWRHSLVWQFLHRCFHATTHSFRPAVDMPDH